MPLLTAMSFMGRTPMLNLTPTSASFPFNTKYMPLVPNIKVVLGHAGPQRIAAATNGWFAVRTAQSPQPVEEGDDLPLSWTHAEVWSESDSIYIRDLGSHYGTYINGEVIKSSRLLRSGDVLALGTPITRTQGTPDRITDDQLKPVIAKVSVVLPS